MKKIILLLLIVAFYTGCAGDKNITIKKAETISVTIEQEGQIITLSGDTAELKRAPFSLIFTLSRPDSIFTSASFETETFNNALAGLKIEELAGFKNPGTDEEPFNKSNILYISADTPNLWYYTDDTDHRFNSVVKSEKGFICRRDISSVINLDQKGEKTDVIKVKQDAIYLVIIMADWNEDYTRMIENSRKIIKLKFII